MARPSLLTAIASSSAFAGNPIGNGIPGITDPHIHIFNNTAYMYAGRDLDPPSHQFVMPDWHIYSSPNLVDWTLETVISPGETYIGENYTSCWAPDSAHKNGSYYFYFSRWHFDIGVMRAPSPIGPFVDELNAPVFPTDLTGYKQYDPSILIDDDVDQSTYMSFGRSEDNNASYYFIAKLRDDMQGLAEPPRKLLFEVDGAIGSGPANDKGTLHKRNGVYYFTAGTFQSTASNIYGPYTYRGLTDDGAHGGNPPGLSSQAHGNYFTWNNQWFHVWTEFAFGKDVARFRDSWMTYVHYRENGDMADDVAFLDAHGPTGVGQYSATWDRIESEWFMAGTNIRKQEGSSGFVVEFMEDGAELFFPLMHDLTATDSFTVSVSEASPGDTLEVKADETILGRCTLTIGTVVCPLATPSHETMDVMLVYQGRGGATLDWFSFSATLAV